MRAQRIRTWGQSPLLQRTSIAKAKFSLEEKISSGFLPSKTFLPKGLHSSRPLLVPLLYKELLSQLNQ